jgi:hypothetical protein
MNISLTKNLSILLHAIQSFSSGGFLKKTDSTLVLKIRTQKSAEQENSNEDSSLCPETSTKMPFKNSISVHTLSMMVLTQQMLQMCLASA